MENCSNRILVTYIVTPISHQLINNTAISLCIAQIAHFALHIKTSTNYNDQNNRKSDTKTINN